MILLLLSQAQAIHPEGGPCLRPPIYRLADRPTFIGFERSTNYPLRVHYDEAAYQSAAADYVTWFDLAWAEQINTLGFRSPPSDNGKDGPDFDVYLVSLGPGEGYTTIDNYKDDTPNDGYSGAAAYIVIDRDVAAEDRASFAVHEFNHALQWGMDYTEDTLPIWEGVANNAQTWTYGTAHKGAWDEDVGSFQHSPWAPALTGSSYFLDYWYGGAPWYEYGAALWVRHIDEILLNNDGAAGAALWNATAQEGWTPLEPDAVDAVQTVTGMELGEFLNSLALSRWLVGDEWDDRGLADAADWKNPRRKVPAQEVEGKDLPATVTFSPGPMPTGQAFVDLTLDGETEPLTIQVSSHRGLGAAVAAFWWDDQGNVGELGEWGLDPELVVETEGLTRVVIAVSNTSWSNWDPDRFYKYTEGDHVLRLWLGDLPEPEPGDAEGPGPAPERRDKKGSACASAPGAVGGWVAIAMVLATRRRQ